MSSYSILLTNLLLLLLLSLPTIISAQNNFEDKLKYFSNVLIDTTKNFTLTNNYNCSYDLACQYNHQYTSNTSNDSHVQIKLMPNTNMTQSLADEICSSNNLVNVWKNNYIATNNNIVWQYYVGAESKMMSIYPKTNWNCS